jgi:hypothetical protein
VLDDFQPPRFIDQRPNCPGMKPKVAVAAQQDRSRIRRALPYSGAVCTLRLARDGRLGLDLDEGVEMKSQLRLGVRSMMAVATLGFVASGFGCISTRVSDLEAYARIPMSRVVPYPPQDELRRRAFEVIVVDRPSVGIGDSMLATPRAQVRRSLEGIAAAAGSAIIDRSLQELDALRTERVLSELDGRAADAVRGADIALATRFSTYRYLASWKKPFRFLWQSAEEVADKPGTCRHTVDVGLDVQVIEIGTNDRVEKTFSLEHSAEQSHTDLDPSCPIPHAALSVLFENTLDEALSCLDRPLGALLSPRGHVTAHRGSAEAKRHIYRVSLGFAQGIQQDDTVEIRREQRAMSPSGEESRTERVIALGRVTDQIAADASWMAIDPSKATTEILEGDIVRPVKIESLLASLSGPNCGSILVQR